MKRLLLLLLPFKKLFFGAVFLTLFLAILSPVRPYLIQFILDEILPQNSISTLNYWIFILLMVILVHGLAQFLYNWLTNSLSQMIIFNLRNRVFNHLINQNVQFYDKNSIGSLQTRTISDIETLNRVFSEGFVEITGDILQVVFVMIAMFWTSWKLSLMVMITFPMILLATYIFKIKVKKGFDNVRKYVSELNGFIQEHISGLILTQLFGQEKNEQKKFEEINKKHAQANIDTIFYYSVFFPVVELISTLAIALLLWYGSFQVVDQALTFGSLVAYLMYLNLFFRPIRMLADQFNTLQMGLVSADRIFKLLDHEQRVIQNVNVENKIEITKAFENQLIRIKFDKVKFEYENNVPILNEISFDAEAGKTIAIVGSTGSGKTSIINLLSRFYEFQSGTITLNNVDIKSIPIEILRAQIGIISQDVFMFSGSIYDNITLFNGEISLEKVKQAAQKINAHYFIEKLTNGYLFDVGEKGSNLSTGQRQIIAFLRILVYDPKILILDEATSNIDSEFENLIQNALNTLLEQRTSIIIAHRLSTIIHADQILVLKNGNIVEKGTHSELFDKKSIYFELYNKQYEKV